MRHRVEQRLPNATRHEFIHQELFKVKYVAALIVIFAMAKSGI